MYPTAGYSIRRNVHTRKKQRPRTAQNLCGGDSEEMRTSPTKDSNQYRQKLCTLRTGDWAILQNTFLKMRVKRAQPKHGIGSVDAVDAGDRAWGSPGPGDCSGRIQLGSLGGLEFGNRPASPAPPSHCAVGCNSSV